MKAAVSALLKRPEDAPTTSLLNCLSLAIAKPFASHHSHTREGANDLADLLLEAVKLHASLAAPLEEIYVPSCMGQDSLKQWARFVEVFECNCPAGMLEWLIAIATEGDNSEEDSSEEDN